MQTSSIVSTFRNNYTILQMERIHRVTGQEFPISGDAPLRFQRRMIVSGRQGKPLRYADTDSIR